MYIKPFAVEEWMNEWESDANYNIAETCVNSISPDELFALTGMDKTTFWNTLSSQRLTYGHIEGSPLLKEGIAALYQTISPRDIVVTHGAAGANYHVFLALLSPQDHVITVCPTYQQLYSIPQALGAKVSCLRLRKENNYELNLEELAQLITPQTKLICLNNPNNPTGALLSEKTLQKVIELAQQNKVWLLCDEVYRHLTVSDTYSPSIADLYEKGISVSSMSKVFSLAGLRLGWIACRDKGFIQQCLSHRDYNLISCGMLDDALATLALQHKDKLLTRNRQIIRENLAILDQWVASEPLISYNKPQAGTTALLHYQLPLDSYSFCQQLFAHSRTLLTPGDCFDEPQTLRIGYACDTTMLRQGLAQVSDFLKSHS